MRGREVGGEGDQDLGLKMVFFVLLDRKRRGWYFDVRAYCDGDDSDEEC